MDKNIGLDVDIAIKCFGEYSYKLTDPMLFYKNVSGNVAENYTRDKIDGQLKTELLTALQPAFARISEMGIRYSALPGHTNELSDALNDVLSKKWSGLRGVAVVSFGVSSVSASEEDEKLIKDLQKAAALRDPNMAAATLASAQADAMKAAASNQGGGGAFMAFAGMNMAQNAGGANANQLFGMAQQQQAAQQSAPAAGSWKCSCGAVNTGKFCTECAKPKPASGSWTCSCGTVNTGKFCTECAKPRPSGSFKCNKCGWVPTDPNNIPKFCPECGDKFDENDKV